MQKALIILDMQNDICHPEGVFHKNGLVANLTKILPPIINVMEFCRQIHMPILSLQSTIFLDLKKQPSDGNLLQSRRFLEKEGLREGTWGHDLLENLPHADYQIRKWGISAFHQTEFEAYLNFLKIQELVLAGFTTNGVVETVAREAIGKHFGVTVLADCVTSYSEALHLASLTNISSFGKLLTSNEWKQLIL
jgi:ureidoacrylate peracid hydrolase